MAHDKKRSAESKIVTLSIRTVRNNRRTEQHFTNRAFNRLINNGI